MRNEDEEKHYTLSRNVKNPFTKILRKGYTITQEARIYEVYTTQRLVKASSIYLFFYQLP